MRNLKRNKGITLVALVITIIVLLILAGVTLNLVMGDSGIFGKARNAKDSTNVAQAEEDVQLRIIEAAAIAEGPVTKESFIQALQNAADDYLIKLATTARISEEGITEANGLTGDINVTNLTRYPDIKVKVKSNFTVESTVIAENSGGSSSSSGGDTTNIEPETISLNAGQSYTIPRGFHSGEGIVNANSLSNQTIGNAIAADIAKNKTAWVNGHEVEGTYEVKTQSITVTINNTSGRTTPWPGDEVTITPSQVGMSEIYGYVGTDVSLQGFHWSSADDFVVPYNLGKSGDNFVINGFFKGNTTATVNITLIGR